MPMGHELARLTYQFARLLALMGDLGWAIPRGFLEINLPPLGWYISNLKTYIFNDTFAST